MQQEQRMLIAGTLFYGITILLTSSAPFFWDTILTSTIAHWFYSNGAGNLIVPEIWDAGHPPFFQLYLAGLWKMFGPGLSLSHWAMFPFLLLLLSAFIQLSCMITGDPAARWTGLLFFLLHPHMLTQTTLVSYDILHTAFFLAAIVAGLKEQKWWLALVITGLASISLRGQVAGFSILLALGIIHRQKLRLIIPTVIMWLIISVGWHLYHYMQTGWMISTPAATWEGQREMLSFQEMIVHTKGIIRGMVDYGSLITTVIGFTGGLMALKSSSPVLKKLLLIAAMTFLILCILLVPFSNPIAHRYFLPYQAILALITGIYLSEKKVAKWIPTFLLAAMVSGHWWLYPEGKSNGWDVTLAHYPYHQNRKALFRDLENKEEVASSFPLFCSMQQTDLLPDNQRLKDISIAAPHSYKIIAWSRICNDMRDIDLKKAGQPLKVYGEGPTAIRLYIRKNED